MWDAHLRLKMTLSTVLYTATIIGVVILYSIESQRMPRLDTDLRPGDAWCTSEQRHFHSIASGLRDDIQMQFLLSENVY